MFLYFWLLKEFPVRWIQSDTTTSTVHNIFTKYSFPKKICNIYIKNIKCINFFYYTNVKFRPSPFQWYISEVSTMFLIIIFLICKNNYILYFYFIFFICVYNVFLIIFWSNNFHTLLPSDNGFHYMMQGKESRLCSKKNRK